MRVHVPCVCVCVEAHWYGSLHAICIRHNPRAVGIVFQISILYFENLVDSDQLNSDKVILGNQGVKNLV